MKSPTPPIVIPATESRLQKHGRHLTAAIPLPWRAYAAYQSSLSDRTSVNSVSWGIEDGLNHLLVAENFGNAAVDIHRIVASGARHDRYVYYRSDRLP